MGPDDDEWKNLIQDPRGAHNISCTYPRGCKKCVIQWHETQNTRG
jgi:hypothetical protein